MPNNSLQAPKRGRGCLLWLSAILVLVVGLVLVGTISESATEASDARAYPPAGQMVDVGGYRLHINCTGTGSPTVVIEAGWGDWSLGWSKVQPGVAQSTRVCSYDRAGMGYSEPGPLPRNAEQYAKELHTLLDRAGVPGPYVLVGHSMGGLPVRVFAHEYPANVAGVVLIESMSPEPSRVPATDASSSTPSEAKAPSIPALLARFGLVRLFAKPTGAVAPEAKPAYAAFSVSRRAVQAWEDEGHGMPASMDQASAVKSLGDLPLIVLTARLDQGAGWQALQTGLLQLSSNSQQLFAEKSDHNIQFDQPQAAVGAIVQMVEQLRQTAKK
jgi:pimeloyl-ACP methyl ester carboxylesterase